MINADELIEKIRKCKTAIFNPYDCYEHHIMSKIKWDRVQKDELNKLLTLINGMAGIECNIYDTEEIHENCTVQIWSNSATGKQSIGWWKNE
jgi:hypothetical protein